MKVPKGLTEQEVLQIIQKTVAYLAPSFKFGYFDTEDMKQEGTIFCLEALDSFNFDKSCQEEVGDALLTFLKTHVRWRFLNMRRKQLTRLEPPICECKLCKNDSANRLDCKKYSNWVKRNVAKKSLMEPFDVSEIHTVDASFTFDIEMNILSSDVIEILNEHVPASIRSDYRRFMEGVSVPKARREKLIQEIKIIISEHYSKKMVEDEDWPT